MVHLNGHAARLRVAFPDLLLLLNRMEVCSVLPITLSIHKNVGLSAVAPIVGCMRLASGIAAPAKCVPNVRKALLPAKPDGSAPFTGRSLLPSRFPRLLSSSRLSRFPSRMMHSDVSLFFGETGHAARSGGGGCRWCGPKPFP